MHIITSNYIQETKKIILYLCYNNVTFSPSLFESFYKEQVSTHKKHIITSWEKRKYQKYGCFDAYLVSFLILTLLNMVFMTNNIRNVWLNDYMVQFIIELHLSTIMFFTFIPYSLIFILILDLYTQNQFHPSRNC